MGADGLPICINSLAIHEAMKMYGVEYEIDCFEKVMKAGRYFINRMREKAVENRG
jgi:hypothetical protein